MLRKFYGSNTSLVNKLNEIVEEVNKLLSISGDPYISIRRIGTGFTVGLDVEKLLERTIKKSITGGARRAYCTADAGAGSTIACKLDSPTGTAITVTCMIHGGTALNAAIPRIATGDYILVHNIDGTWYSWPYQASQDCS